MITIAIFREIGDRIEEGIALGNLGNAHYSLGDYRQAIDYHQKSLTIVREIQDRPGEERDLVRLGKAYCALGDYAKAIECNQQHLAIVQATQAELYQRLGHRDLALEHCDQALAIATELGIPLATECQELKKKLPVRYLSLD